MKVFICSPFAALAGLKTTVEGHFMLAPHLYFPQFLDDGECKGTGEPSPGMKTEIAYAEEHRIPIRYFPAEQEDHFDD